MHKVCYQDVFMIDLDSLKSVNLKEMTQVKESLSITNIGNVIVSIGGCDSVTGKCTNKAELIKILDEKEIDEEL